MTVKQKQNIQVILPDYITIGHWNTAGLRYNYKPSLGTIDMKTEGTLDIESHIKGYDVYAMTETWLDNDSKELIPKPKGYYSYHNIRTKSKKAWRPSGGISIFIRNNIKEGIQIIETNSKFSQWCKMKKDFFNLEKDIYICTTYIPPKNSSFYNNNIDSNPYEDISKEIQQYSIMGHIILQGDFNARTKNLIDTIINDEDNSHLNIPLPQTYKFDKTVNKRRNCDSWKNEFGEELTQLCRTNHLRILNGRTSGDWSGKLTCYNYHGASTVDYAITSESLLKNIIHFKVGNLHSASDHCPIKTTLKTPQYTPTKDINIGLKPVQSSYQWNNSNRELYKLFMKTKESEDMPTLFINSITGKNTNQMAQDFQNMIANLASKCSMFKTKKKSARKRKIVYTDRQSNMKKKELQTIANMIQRNPSDGTLRVLYYSKKKEFRKYVKQMQKYKQEKIISQIENANENESAQEFWKKINSIKNLKENNKVKEIPYTTWTDHFQLISKNINTTPDRINEIEKKLEQIENKMNDNLDINYPIELTEVIQTLKQLKNNKATGPDGIPGEMLKYSNKKVKQTLQKLYNNILDTGIYPEIWNTSIITPIHKKGSQRDTNNYRGISVGNVIAKVFSMIINKRISKYLESNSIILPNQAGFRQKHRTVDHVLTLHTIIKKYQTRKKKIYCCFVDLKKCFDTVWQTALYYKLMNYNINGKVYTVIKNMYKNMDFTIKLNDMLTEKFKIENGVKQGCPLSPTLFNIFINDFITGLESDRITTPELYGKFITCLLYADDIALLSTTSEGLQKSIDFLYEYTNKWGLQVNIEKTQVIIFRRNGCKTNEEQFKYGEKQIKIEEQYTYLGVIFKSNGSITLTANRLADKAHKVAMLQSKLYTTSKNIAKIREKLFNATQIPILTYAGEIWGIFLNQETWDKTETEKCHLKLCRQILNVGNKASKIGCRMELGREPLISNIYTSAINYYLYLKKINKCNLAFYALKDMEKNKQKGSWLTTLESNLKLYKQENISNLTKLELKTSIKKHYEKDWNIKNKNENAKLRTYSTFKNKLEQEEYINILKHKQHVKIIAKFRLSCHKLAIEKGRYTQPKTPVEDRLCSHCQVVEDELHHLINCKMFNTERSILFNTINSINSRFAKSDNNEQFQFILMSKDHNIIVALLNYLKTCNKI